MKYKKSLTITISLVLLVLGSYFILNLTETKTIKKDRKYIKNLLDTYLAKGMTTEQVSKYFNKSNRKVNFMECADGVSNESICKSEKRLVTTLPLPSNNIWLGKGDAQIYLYIDASDKLEYYDFELYYPRIN